MSVGWAEGDAEGDAELIKSTAARVLSTAHSVAEIPTRGEPFSDPQLIETLLRERLIRRTTPFCVTH